MFLDSMSLFYYLEKISIWLKNYNYNIYKRWNWEFFKNCLKNGANECCLFN